ncbi:tyrosine-type recombinase/integrase [Micromonospora humida]|uniref:tyrosine-type recombinase/integrase n=1 Tax=Micromonospora humida TaxID=2809018 RepID=UPI00366C9642
MVALAAGTGLRWGECVGLRWDAVDLAVGELRVVRVAEEISGHVTLKPYPKSRAGRRTVPLPPFVVQALTEHRQAFETGTEDLIFVARTGEPLKRGTFRARVWKPSLHEPIADRRAQDPGGKAVALADGGRRQPLPQTSHPLLNG